MTTPRTVRHLIPVTALATLVVSTAACTRSAAPAAEPAPQAATRPAGTVTLDADAQARAGIVVEAVASTERTDGADAPAVIAVDETHTARIGSVVDGRVTAVPVQVGSRVRADQLLADVHSHEVHDAWAGYRRAEAEVRRLDSELRFATDARTRAGRLFEAKAVSQQDVQRAEANQVAAAQALDVAHTEVRRAEEEMEHLGISGSALATATPDALVPIRTPLAGAVLERLVAPGTAVTPGTAMFVVSDLSTVWALAEVDESQLAHLTLERPAAVRVAAWPDAEFPGTITSVSDTVNPETHRVPVRVTVKNPDGRLKPSMYATVRLSEGDPHQVLTVPSAAIQTIDGQPNVFVRTAERTYRLQAVDVGPAQGGRVDIRRGLQAGDQVVVSGAFILKSELLKSAAGSEE